MGSSLPIILTFCFYGLFIVLVNSVASRKNKDFSDFVLAGRNLSGTVTAFGAGAADMSGWLLMALPGYLYLSGASKLWMPVALTLGAYLNWRIVASRLRVYTELAKDSLTIPAFLMNRFKSNSRVLRLAIGMVLIVFFTYYSVAGFVSGALLIKWTFGLSYNNALFIIASGIIAYTTIGGFVAINWLDFFQGMLIFFALLLVPIVTCLNIGGMESLITKTNTINPGFFKLFDDITMLGVISLFCWGLGYFGQPHILARFMAVKNIGELKIARRIGISWMSLSMLGAVLTGWTGYIFFIEKPLAKPETVFIALSYLLFNPWITGILLSAVLSAILSTVAAQILMASSIFTEDFYTGNNKIFISRVATLCIVFIACMLAINPNLTVMQSVAFPWCGLGAAFGPIILFSLYWRSTTLKAAISGILTGALTVVLFEYFSATTTWFTEHGVLVGFSLLPAFILSSIVIVVVSLIDNKSADELQDDFNTMLARI